MPNPTRLTALLLLTIGCGSDADKDSARAGTDEAATVAPTWSDDIAPIVARDCTGCHVAGGSAPFPLQTYSEVSAMAEVALASMEAGSMPPWLPDPDCRPLHGERIMDPGDIEQFAAWVAADTPEGDPTSPIEVTIESLDPDLSGLPVEAYTPNYTTDPDDYRCFVLDLDFPEEVYISGSQVIPGSPAVHHVLVYALVGDQIAQMEAADAAEAGPGYTCFGGPVPSIGDSSGFGALASGFPNQIAAWVPGIEPAIHPDDLGIRVDAGAKVVMQVHYSAAAAEPSPDQTRLDLTLHDAAPSRLMTSRPFAITALDIPAGEAEVTVEQTIRNYSDTSVELGGFAAHMHLLGAAQRIETVRAGDPSECVLDIPEWDFDWQQNYSLPNAGTISIAPGEGLSLQCTFDNSAENQPTVDGVQQEPQDVGWGEGSLDEMCLAYLNVVEPYAPPESTGALACEASADCWSDCDTDDFTCLLTCDTLQTECLSCAVSAGLECGLTSCAASLVVAEECLTACVMSELAFDGPVGACLEAECADEMAAFGACAQDTIETGACDTALAACGLPE